MTNTELITQALEYAEWADANIYEVPITLPDVLRKLANRVEEQAWISVKDKLPELTKKGKWCRESDHVLCAIKAETQLGIRYIVKEGCYAESGYWRIPGSQSNVVAWMSLPEPPTL